MKALFLSLALFCLSMAPAFAKTNEYQMAVCMALHEDAPHLKEWLEYHKMIGVDHFYLFAADPSTALEDLLAPYLKAGEVELFFDTSGAYEKALALARRRAKWLAYLESGDFIVPLHAFSLTPVLKNERRSIVYLWGLLFKVPQLPSDSLLIEACTQSSKKMLPLGQNRLGAMLVRPDKVRSLFEEIEEETLPVHNKILIYRYRPGIKPQEVRDNRSMQRFVPDLRALLGLPVRGNVEQQASGCGCGKR